MLQFRVHLLFCARCSSKEDVRFLIDSWAIQTGPHHKVTFIGGGEPTTKWSLLEWAIRYIREKIGTVEIVLVTNGSLLSPDKIVFLKKERVQISLSYDILPDIQDSQRLIYKSSKSSFHVVDLFLKEVATINANSDDTPIHVGIRCTITPSIVKKMTDMVRFVSDNYSGVVRRVHFEHVTSTNNPGDFYKQYEEAFFEARNFGRSVGLEISNSLTSSQGKVRSSFCRRESCFVPAGENRIICTACHRVSSPRDSFINVFKYAESYKHGEFCIRGPRHDEMRGISKECEKCPAKWQCAGGCIMERRTLSPEQLRMKCEMVRGFNRRLLEEKLNEI